MECPKRGRFSSLSKMDEAQEETKMGSLQLLNSINVKVEMLRSARKGRMYVMAKVSGFDTKALLDTGALYNFLEVGEAKGLGFTYVKEQGWLKTVNFTPKPIYGVAKGVRLHIGKWCGLVDFSVVDMDNFKMVFGIEFLHNVRAFPIPFSNSMCIMSEGNVCIVSMAREVAMKAKTMSAMQLNKGLKMK